ncbi:MAG: 30S ribosomal protein S4 [Nitrososphaerota archaeon]|jgi:small subunit ribosomal protein S4|nr:30S ribosomal protein S4 [Nitrososphaerota archaeon]MDG6942134.1 30S ribosomal protein S4 [Nitrososphaerota archaeon]MDG6942599.1 30S ribosomal protein S4 [Nitrososphaerota archaeon]MDG6948386.1 30S ribosomal protein S4 [Nitrososphaerota archaeon]MDG6950312.1 30S ribosomal protein S4 [Nitrososphaerota archaeon]
MGDPKKSRKQYNRPRSPWRADQLAQELYLLGTFGLRNKRELWKAQTQLSGVRKQARTLLAATQVVRQREEKKLLDSLRRKGLVGEGATLDDILSLTVEDMLARRLQTMVFKKGMALSPLHSRQLIVHGHIAVGGRIITIPGYEVGGIEEGTVALTGDAAKAVAPADGELTVPAEQPAQAQ